MIYQENGAVDELLHFPYYEIEGTPLKSPILIPYDGEEPVLQHRLFSVTLKKKEV